MFHCHIAFHLEMGMSMVIQVGEIDEMPKPPKHFPKCGDWTPESQDENDFEDSKSCPPVPVPTSAAPLTTTVATTTTTIATVNVLLVMLI